MLNNQYVCSQSGRPGGAEKRKAILLLWWAVELCYGTVLTSLMNCVCPPPYVCYIGGGWYSPMYIGSYQCRWSVVLPMWTHCLGCRCRTDQSQVRQMVDSEYTTLGRILAPGSPQVRLTSGVEGFFGLTSDQVMLCSPCQKRSHWLPGQQFDECYSNYKNCPWLDQFESSSCLGENYEKTEEQGKKMSGKVSIYWPFRLQTCNHFFAFT